MPGANAEETGIAGGNSEGARGYGFCVEIVRARAVAKAVPIIRVSGERSRGQSDP